MDLEVRHLQLVRAVAAVGGLTNAGRDLRLSQSALSHQLRYIESRLGTPLFLRVGKRMVPTAAGERLIQSAHEILAALAGAETAIRMLAGGGRGRLRVSVAGYASYRWLPTVLKRYRMIRPQVEVQITGGGPSDSLSDLLSGAVDVAITAAHIDDKRVLAEPLFRDEVVVAVAPAHRLAGKPIVDAADLGGEPLFVDAAKRDGGVYQQTITALGGAPASVLVIADIAATLELVNAGVGVAVVGRWVVDPLVRAGRLRTLRITRQGVWCQWTATALERLTASADVREFVDLVAREMRQLDD